MSRTFILANKFLLFIVFLSLSFSIFAQKDNRSLSEDQYQEALINYKKSGEAIKLDLEKTESEVDLISNLEAYQLFKYIDFQKATVSEIIDTLNKISDHTTDMTSSKEYVINTGKLGEVVQRNATIIKNAHKLTKGSFDNNTFENMLISNDNTIGKYMLSTDVLYFTNLLTQYDSLKIVLLNYLRKQK